MHRPTKKMVVKGRKIEPENPTEVQPEYSEKVSSEEDSETESQPGQAQVNQILPNSTVNKVGIEPSSSSKAHNESEFSSPEQEESESEGDSGSESEGGGDYFVVPSAPKSVAAPQKSVLADGKDILKESETPSKAGSKRTTEAMETKGRKKAKKIVDQSHGEPEPTSSKKKLELRGEISVSDEVKKQPFERIWSEVDEIVFLRGMIDCAKMNKSEPALLDLDQFHEFMRVKLHFDASRTQVQNKIKSMKKKYMSNRTKELKNQCAPVFSKHHEQEAYLLSKEIWGEKISQTIEASPQSTVARKKQIKMKMEGGHNGKSDEMKMENGKSEDINVENEKSEDINVENEKSEDINMVNGDSDNLVRMLEIADGLASPSFNMDIWIRSIGTKLYAADDMSQGAKEWCQLAVEEIELYDKKLTLMSARAKLVISGLKSKIG